MDGHLILPFSLFYMCMYSSIDSLSHLFINKTSLIVKKYSKLKETNSVDILGHCVG